MANQINRVNKNFKPPDGQLNFVQILVIFLILSLEKNRHFNSSQHYHGCYFALELRARLKHRYIYAPTAVFFYITQSRT